jgi:uncharacterized membrane protein
VNLPTTELAGPAPARARLESIDLIRGAVMILMAIDHVRVYSGLPAGGATPGLFFPRWVTHFCAPAFVFFAGTSAYLYGRRHSDLSRFLLSRGLWLVFLELTFFRIVWTFNFDLAHWQMAGVIWVIGWSMIVLAVLVKLPLSATGGFGVAMIAFHNLMDPRMPALLEGMDQNRFAAWWKIAYVGFFAGPVHVGGTGGLDFMVLYSLVPWIGVMAAGYAFGRVVTLDSARRRRACLTIGLGAIALFLVLRGFNLYGDPRPWSPPQPRPDGSPGMPALFSFLNTSKYPASLLFLLMTLGPTIALVPALERARGALARVIATFGRVPFFFYALHIPLLHLLALGVSKIRLGAVNPWLFTNHPMGNPEPPDGYTWSLGTLYLVWAIAIALLYPACRWFAHLKSRRRDWWLSYL